MLDALDGVESTAQIQLSKDPFERIVGQDHAVVLVKSAVMQRRHVLLCGVPGIGKSMLAQAAATLLPQPKEEVCIRRNPSCEDRPLVTVHRRTAVEAPTPGPIDEDTRYVRPEELPVAVAIRMGYRCPMCTALSSPVRGRCTACGARKRASVSGSAAYLQLFRTLDVMPDPAEESVTIDVEEEGYHTRVTYEHEADGMIRVTRTRRAAPEPRQAPADREEHILVAWDTPRFVRLSGASPTELLGDVRHDPYGGVEGLGVPPHKRVVAGAVHEAHEGILYIDELATLGPLQKHLLTAMQERKYPIVGRNPHSAGAAVRVDDVPCDFILFASCNLEDLPNILPPLRSRIRGYGYEVMLSSWMEKSPESAGHLVRFIAQTIAEDGRIPHMSVDAIEEVLDAAEKIAYQMDRQRDAFTLRLRELGGIVRIAGDVACQEGDVLIRASHVRSAVKLNQMMGQLPSAQRDGLDTSGSRDTYGDYFF